MLRASRTFSTLGFALAAAAASAHAQPGTGALFGARDARRCTVPAPKGAPTPAEAARAVACRQEHVDGSVGQYLYLVDNLSVQVGRARPYHCEFNCPTDSDPSKPTYPIRGSFVSYQCTRRQDALTMGYDPNKNCRAYPQPNASGDCWATTFGDMACELHDLHAKDYTDGPPPRP